MTVMRASEGTPGSLAGKPGRRPQGRPLRSRFWWGVALLTAGQLGLRTWAAAGGWFYWDDFWWHDIVARNALPRASMLSLGGHLSPATYVPYWLLTHWFPYEWGSRVVVMVVTLLGIDAGVLALVRRLWPTNGPRLSVYALWCFSSLAAPSWLWYSQFSMTGALLLTSTWCLWGYLRAVQERTRGSAVLAVALLVLALLAQERMLSMALVSGLFLFFVASGGRPRVVLRGVPGLWAVSGAVLVVYSVFYRHLAQEQPGSQIPQLLDAAKVGVRMLSTSFIPALLGGPWRLDETPVLGRAAPGGVLQALAGALLISAVIISQRVNARAWHAWLLLAFAALADVGLVLLGRGSTLGAQAVGEWRYFSDLAVMAPLLLVAAFVVPGQMPRLDRRTTRFVQTAVGIVVGGGVLTTVLLGVRWHTSTARPFFITAVASFRSHPQAVVMDRVLPESVVNPALGAQRLASRVFSIVQPPVDWDSPAADPMWLEDGGRLVPGDLVSTRSRGDSTSCMMPVRGTMTSTVDLPGEWNFDWGLRIDYRMRMPARLAVRAGEGTVLVDVPERRGRVYVPVVGIGHSVAIFATDPYARGCITQVASGRAGAAHG